MATSDLRPDSRELRLAAMLVSFLTVAQERELIAAAPPQHTHRTGFFFLPPLSPCVCVCARPPRFFFLLLLHCESWPGGTFLFSIQRPTSIFAGYNILWTRFPPRLSSSHAELIKREERETETIGGGKALCVCVCVVCVCVCV